MKNKYFLMSSLFLLVTILLTCLLDFGSGAVIRSSISDHGRLHGPNKRPLDPFMRRQSKFPSRRNFHNNDVSSEGSESEEESLESVKRRLENDANTPSPLYATQLFNLLGQADMNNDEEIDRVEYSVWNTALKFPENDAKNQFDQMDKNKDSILSYGEYYTWVQKFWTNSKAYVRQTFRDADTDMNGKVGRDEYLKWHHSFENTKAADTELEFLNADTNQDDLITVKDFEMTSFLKAADQNLDGQLSLQEYLAETLKYLPSFLSPTLQKKKDQIHFYEMDTNFNGFLSLRELEDEMQ